MENTTKDEKVTITHEVAKVPAEVGTAIVGSVETAGHEVAKVVVEGATVVVDATKAAVSEIAKAGEQLGRDSKQAVSPAPESVKAPAPPVVAPVAAAPADPVEPIAVVAPSVAGTTEI
jgi:hypothetical protein